MTIRPFLAFLFLFPASNALADAMFSPVGSAALDILSISSTDEFIISIDPLFTDPNSTIVELTNISSTGGTFVDGQAMASLNAADPFDVGVGDSLVVHAYVSGTTLPPLPTTAAAEAVAEVGISLINHSNVDVVVEFALFYYVSAETLIAAPTEMAFSGAKASVITGLTGGGTPPAPFNDEVFTTFGVDTVNMLTTPTPFTFVVPAGSIGSVLLSTSAFAEAEARLPSVPEPGSLGLIVAGLIALGRRRRA